MLFGSVTVLAAATLSLAAPVTKRGKVIQASVRKHVAAGTKAHHIAAHDTARLQSFRKTKDAAVEDPITNDGVSYVASVGFGSPATDYSLIVDTGSSNTWAKSFNTKGATSTGHSVSVSYGSGEFSGTEYTDTITLGAVVIAKQGVGRATSSSGFTGIDGILGVGPEDLTQGTVSGVSEVPTVMQNAVSQGKISANILGVLFAPASSTSDKNGELTLGGVDSSKYTGSITYQKVLTSGQAAPYWGLSITSSLASGARQGIVDTGTTLVYLPASWYNAWLAKIPSAKVDSSSGLVRFPKSSLSSVPDITFTIGGTSFVFNKYAQLVEKALYSDFGLSSSYYYSWVGNSGTNSGVSFILGQKFMERYYAVFDTDNARIGFAKTSNSLPTAAP